MIRQPLLPLVVCVVLAFVGYLCGLLLCGTVWGALAGIIAAGGWIYPVLDPRRMSLLHYLLPGFASSIATLLAPLLLNEGVSFLQWCFVAVIPLTLQIILFVFLVRLTYRKIRLPLGFATPLIWLGLGFAKQLIPYTTNLADLGNTQTGIPFIVEFVDQGGSLLLGMFAIAFASVSLEPIFAWIRIHKANLREKNTDGDQTVFSKRTSDVRSRATRSEKSLKRAIARSKQIDTFAKLQPSLLGLLFWLLAFCLVFYYGVERKNSFVRMLEDGSRGVVIASVPLSEAKRLAKDQRPPTNKQSLPRSDSDAKPIPSLPNTESESHESSNDSQGETTFTKKPAIQNPDDESSIDVREMASDVDSDSTFDEYERPKLILVERTSHDRVKTNDMVALLLRSGQQDILNWPKQEKLSAHNSLHSNIVSRTWNDQQASSITIRLMAGFGLLIGPELAANRIEHDQLLGASANRLIVIYDLSTTSFIKHGRLTKNSQRVAAISHREFLLFCNETHGLSAYDSAGVELPMSRLDSGEMFLSNSSIMKYHRRIPSARAFVGWFGLLFTASVSIPAFVMFVRDEFNLRKHTRVQSD